MRTIRVVQIVLKLFPLRRLERHERLRDWATERFEHIEKMLCER